MATKELSKPEYIQKYIQTFEDYKKEIQTCFEYSDDTISRLYEQYCNSSYREYLQRIHTENDPGTIL